MVHIGNSWDEILKDEFKSEYYLKLREFLKKEYASHHIYPNMYDISTHLNILIIMMLRRSYSGRIHIMVRDRLTDFASR